MLSRTADHLYWMARYIERAENTARMLDVNLSTSLLPQSGQAAESGWRAMLSISELLPEYDARYPMLSRREVIDFMVRDPGNTSSIYCCLQAARENARAVRGSLTTEVWETHNDTWLGLQKLLRDRLLERDPQEFFEWVKFRSHLSRGVTIGTMLKDEAFYFIRLGTFLERADNTARLLDVKYHSVAQPGLSSAFDERPSRTVLDSLIAAAARLPDVGAVLGWPSSRGSVVLGSDGQNTFFLVALDAPPDSVGGLVAPFRRTMLGQLRRMPRHEDYEVRVTGRAPLEFDIRADHPFLFVLTEKATHAPLFMGLVRDPR